MKKRLRAEMVSLNKIHRSIDTYKPPVIRTTFRALKLDLADINEHVGIKRKKGFFKQLRFTPENPGEFVSKVREIFKLNG